MCDVQHLYHGTNDLKPKQLLDGGFQTVLNICSKFCLKKIKKEYLKVIKINIKYRCCQ